MADDTLVHTPPAAFTPPPAPLASKPAEPDTAASKLRAFEDKTFGKDAPRINGELERGVGSPYSRMTVEQKAHHASLEHLVKCEKAVADASAALADAQQKHFVAVNASNDAAKAVDTATKAA